MEKAEADVQSMSDEALDIIKSVGKNEFLEEIVLNLIHRKDARCPPVLLIFSIRNLRISSAS